MQTKTEKRGLAEERREVRSLRSEKKQLEELDRRLGDGLGAKRERARLKRQRALKAVA